VPAGIDIRERTILVATPAGTARYRNAIRRLEDAETGDGATLTVSLDGGSYAIDVPGDDGADDQVGHLFGGAAPGDPADLRRAAVEAMMAESSGGASELEGPLGYVDCDGEVYTELSDALVDRVAVERVDPGMAVCYDAFGSSPTGLGVVISEGVAYATLAVEGVPFATARCTYEGRWYDVTDAADLGEQSVRSEWARIQYETLFAALAAELARRTPELDQPVGIALGGEATPEAVGSLDVSFVDKALDVDAGPVAVPDAPEEAPARGALAAVQDGDVSAQPVPAFAATDGYAPDLADVDATADAIAESLDGSGGGAGPATAGHQPEEAGPGASRGGARIDTAEGASSSASHALRVAAALDRLVDRIDATERLDDLRDEVDAAIAEVEARLDERKQDSAETVADLETSVAELERELGELADDVGEIRAVLAGLEDGDVDAPDVSGAVESMAVDALQADIDAVESDLSSRIEGLWEEVDDLNDDVVDVSARVGELPDIEGAVESTRESVRELSEETADLRTSLGELQETVESLESETVTRGDIQSVAADLDGVADDLETLRRQFEGVDRVDPKQVEGLQQDLDALRDTVLNHAQRLEGVEGTTSDLDDRLERAYRNTAKAEALSSLQAQVNRVEDRAVTAEEAATGAEKTVTDVDRAVSSLREDVDQLRSMTDSLAENTPTRSTVDKSLDDIERRLEALEHGQQQSGEQPAPVGGVASKFMLQLLAVGLASVGGLASVLAIELDLVPLAVGFLVLVIGPAGWLWISLADV